MIRKSTWLVAALLFAASPLAQAQRSLPNSFYIFPQFTTSQSFAFEGGTTANTDTGTGFGFGYERTLNKNFSAGAEVAWSSSSYRATVQPGPGNNANGALNVNGHVSSSTVRFFGNYNILDNALTPYLTAGLGWTYINSDIPNGLPQGACWWSPWYGQVCGSYTPTRNTTKFSYNVGIGIKQDFAQTMFIRGAVNAQWVQIGDTGSTQWTVWRVDLGWRF